jgi:hypothetical protein
LRANDNVGTHEVASKARGPFVLVVPWYKDELSNCKLFVAFEWAAASCIIDDLGSDFVGFVQEILLRDHEVVDETLDCVGRCGCGSCIVRMR